MYGLGDSIYQRAVVRALPGIHYLRTPWPQLYADLPNIRCVRPVTRLRTQAKNAARATTWATPPASLAPRRANYVQHRGTMLEGLCQAFGVRLPAVTFDLPPFPSPMPRDQPYVLVRPATVRAEWRADARNPRAEYLDAAARAASAAGYRVISVADLAEGQEWLDGPAPFAHQAYHHGELSLELLLGLVRGAAGVIGGVGWLAPAAIAYRVPMLLLYGGWGFHNGPQRIFDPRLDVSRITQVIPDTFCMCSSSQHACNKTISDLDRHLDAFLVRCTERQSPELVAGPGHGLLPGHGLAL